MALVIAISSTYIYAQEEEYIEPKPTKEAVRKHCEKFIDCIMSGKLEEALTYMAAEYVRDQHDIFLGGATTQFLREFIAGNSLVGDDFIVPDNISDIESIKITEILIDISLKIWTRLLYNPIYLLSLSFCPFWTNGSDVGTIFTIENIVALAIAIIGAFLGFFLAISFERLRKKYQEKNNKRILIQGICIEIRSIKNDVKQIDENFYYLSPLEKPFWESAVHSGTISLIANNTEIYPKILSIYAMVDTINRWQNMKTQIYYANGSSGQKKITNSITKHMFDLSEAITEMELVLNNYTK